MDRVDTTAGKALRPWIGIPFLPRPRSSCYFSFSSVSPLRFPALPHLVCVGCLFSSSVLFFTFDRYQLAWSFPCRAQGCGRLGSIRSTACCSDCCVARGEQLATDGVPFLIIK